MRLHKPLCINAGAFTCARNSGPYQHVNKVLTTTQYGAEKVVERIGMSGLCCYHIYKNQEDTSNVNLLGCTPKYAIKVVIGDL